MLVSEVGLNFSSQVLIQFGFQDYIKSSVVYGFKPLCCCCCSGSWSCLTLCDPMDYSTSGLPVPHHLLKFAQVHVHCIVMLCSHLTLWCPLFLLPSIFPSIRDFSNESAVCIRWPSASVQHQLLPKSIQSLNALRLTGFISFLYTGFSVIFSSTTVWRHQFFGILPSLGSSSQNCTWPLGKLSPWLYGPLSAESCPCFSTHCLGLS